MLLDVRTNSTNVVICRHNNLLFARSIAIGTKLLDSSAESDDAMNRLVLELSDCRRQSATMYTKLRIERMVFLSGQSVSTNVCATIAKQLEIPAQMGDCLAAVDTAEVYGAGMDKKLCQSGWATAFGLSLS